ncbi:hypothetical protein [Clostridium hydrogenum]|uniref:hypothetical protein n=1 Tax=Clostridium hydrogenum TaxID=2855764 RepID=UPI001F239A35|nr:hypothetical protein [Clostridium hydrogenum]
MIKIDKFTLFEKMYYQEIEQKEKINSRTSIPLSVIFLLVASLGFFFKDIKKFPNATWVGYYKISLAAYCILVCMDIVLVCVAYYGYSYKYIQSPVILEKDYKIIDKYFNDNYEKYFKINTNKTKEELIISGFKDHLCDQYATCTENNTKLNEKKLIYLRYTGWLIMASIVLCAITYLIYILNYN